MLYGHKEMLDNRVASIVCAADTVQEYEAWFTVVLMESKEDRNWNETYASSLLDHMTRQEFKGYKKPVLALYHDSEEQREAFFAQHNVKVLQSLPARDKQNTMLFVEQRRKDKLEEAAEEIAAAAEGREVTGRTIEEIYGLDKSDRWDRRSEEEKESDRQMKERIKEARKKGEMSGDSFSGADAQRAAREEERAAAEGRESTNPKTDDGTAHVSDIRVKRNADGTIKRNADGSIEIDNALAHKRGGEVDSDAKKAAQEAHAESVAEAKGGKRYFSPEDFAAVLRGDGSADHLDIKGDDRQGRGANVAPPKLSEHAEEERRKYQEKQALAKREANKEVKNKADAKAKLEHANGVFRGSDLGGDDYIKLEELPEEMQESLKQYGESFPVKDYPYNSALGNRVLLPFDGVMTPNAHAIIGTKNLEVEGTVSMGEPAVMVASKRNDAEPAWAIYGKTVPAPTKDDPLATKPQIQIVRIR